MKKLIAALAFTLVHAYASAELWVQYWASEKGESFYNIFSIVRDGEIRRVETLINLSNSRTLKGVEKSYKSITAIDEMRCDSRTWRSGFIKAWTEFGGEGNLVYEAKGMGEDFQLIMRAENIAALYKIVCIR